MKFIKYILHLEKFSIKSTKQLIFKIVKIFNLLMVIQNLKNAYK